MTAEQKGRKIYTVYDRFGNVVACKATALECAEKMGIRPRSFWRAKTELNKKWTVIDEGANPNFYHIVPPYGTPEYKQYKSALNRRYYQDNKLKAYRRDKK